MRSKIEANEYEYSFGLIRDNNERLPADPDLVSRETSRIVLCFRKSMGNTNNEFGRFDALSATVDKARVRAYFEGLAGSRLSPPKVNIAVDKLLREFVFKVGFDIRQAKSGEPPEIGLPAPVMLRGKRVCSFFCREI